eukprot:530400-Hanusia_phi.AAC.1
MGGRGGDQRDGEGRGRREEGRKGDARTYRWRVSKDEHGYPMQRCERISLERFVDVDLSSFKNLKD